MSGTKVLNFLKNSIVYSYRGLFATIYFIFRKTKKIDEMFALDDENQVNMDSNNAFVKKNKNEFAELHDELYDKISFRYKAKNKMVR